MTTALLRSLFLVATFAAIADRTNARHEYRLTPEADFAEGSLVVCYPESGPTDHHLLIHFHGAPETLRQAITRTRTNAVLAIVNFRGLSSAYRKPFEEDAALFDALLQRTAEVVDSETGIRIDAWQRLSLSSFSAGYGAVREILKSPAAFDRVNSLVAADSIYAGLDPNSHTRAVDPDHMRDFLTFAREATEGRRHFIISHSQLETPYASTVETADDLLLATDVPRQDDSSLRLGEFRQLTRAARAGFIVLGFEGTTGDGHLAHLRHIDVLWDQLADKARE